MCSGRQGNAIQANYSGNFQYGVTVTAANALTHTGAVCNSVAGQINDTYTYTGLADNNGHFMNVGYSRWYNSRIYYRTFCSYNTPDGVYHHCGEYLAYGPAVGQVHYYRAVRASDSCNAAYVDDSFIKCYPNAGWGVLREWYGRAGASTHWIASDIAGNIPAPVRFSGWRLCHSGGACYDADLPATQKLDSRYFFDNFAAGRFDQGTR